VKGRDARKDRTRARYQALADRGMTMAEAARALGVSQNAVSHAAKRLGITFADRTTPLHYVPAEKLEDYETLMKRGGYSAEQALATITAPKRKVTWRAPE
jgi:transposase-like protein